MKVKGSILSVFMAIVLIGNAYAQELRISSAWASISFSNTTATCYVEVIGKGSDKISATIELCCGNQSIKTWNKYSNNGCLILDEQVDVTKGNTYELVVKYSVNGNAQQSFSDSGTCR